MLPDQSRRTVLMTGITSGMGLHAARAILEDPRVRIVAGLRSPDRSGAPADLPAERLTTLALDLGSLASVTAFCDAVRDRISAEPIDAVARNAGTQITSGLELSTDGIEKTFAVNHLGHWLLVERLSDLIARDAPIVVTASGTHDPDDPVAGRFGFRGGVFLSAERVATGELDPGVKPAQRCLDRYATPKMANVMHVLHKARTDADHRWVAYDPGLMPGTGLARDRGALERFAWSRVMPLLRYIMKGVSTPERSGARLAELLLDERAVESGDYVEFTGRRLDPWAKTRDEALQDDLHETSRRLVMSAR